MQGKEVGGRPIAVKIAVNSQTEEDADEPDVDAKPEREATPEVTVVAS